MMLAIVIAFLVALVVAAIVFHDAAGCECQQRYEQAGRCKSKHAGCSSLHSAYSLNVEVATKFPFTLGATASALEQGGNPVGARDRLGLRTPDGLPGTFPQSGDYGVMSVTP